MAKTVKKTAKDNLTPFPKGKSGNPNGRPKGQRNYATIYREALEKIGKTRGITPEEVEVMIEEVGLYKAMKGDFAFYKDVRDRLHGKAMQNTDITSGGNPLIVQFDNAFISPSKKVSK